MDRQLNKWLLLLLVSLMVGCGTPLKARVTTFHNLPPELQPITFAVVPFEWQMGSLEFETYARQVNSGLAASGMRPVPVDQAAYVVFLAYAIDEGRQVAFSYPIYGQTGVSSSTTTGLINSYGNTASYSGTTTYNPTYGVVGSGAGTRTDFNRVVRLEILDASALASGAVRKLYEGQVTSTGTTGELSAVMPTLIRALFQGFPGASGRSRDITLPVE